MTSRPPPPRFEGCTLDGVRYEADYPTTDTHRSGGVVAIDEASGRRLWQAMLWTQPREILGGLIVPPHFLHRVEPDVRPGRLRAQDEYGMLYVIDLISRKARCLGCPSDVARGFPRPGDRIGPPSPARITFEGQCYEQIEDGDSQSLDQRTGLMAITDQASGRRVDVVSIYDYPRGEGQDGGDGDVFFLSAALDASQREIVIENERHERFAYRIDDGSVRRLV